MKKEYFSIKPTTMDVELILEKISELKTEVEAMQADSLLRKDYSKKVKELMYWRRRYTQLPKEKKIQQDE